MDKVCLKIIGVVHSPFRDLKEVPPQPVFLKGTEATIEIFSEYARALAGLEEAEYIFVITYLHKSQDWEPEVVSRRTGRREGVFATRSPRRPNPIGLSLVKLKEIRGNFIFVESIDLLDGTPVLDVKPFVGEIDIPEGGHEEE